MSGRFAYFATAALIVIIPSEIYDHEGRRRVKQPRARSATSACPAARVRLCSMAATSAAGPFLSASAPLLSRQCLRSLGGHDRGPRTSLGPLPLPRRLAHSDTTRSEPTLRNRGYHRICVFARSCRPQGVNTVLSLRGELKASL